MFCLNLSMLKILERTNVLSSIPQPFRKERIAFVALVEDFVIYSCGVLFITTYDAKHKGILLPLLLFVFTVLYLWRISFFRWAINIAFPKSCTYCFKYESFYCFLFQGLHLIMRDETQKARPCNDIK